MILINNLCFVLFDILAVFHNRMSLAYAKGNILLGIFTLTPPPPPPGKVYQTFLTTSETPL